MSLPHLILGILKYRPLSGYDLNKAFGDSVQHFWNTDQSQIYRALHKLHADGLVEVEDVIQESLPAKKIYHLTGSGREELLRWLTTPLGLSNTHEGWLGQLFFAAELDGAQLMALLEARRDELRRLIARYEHLSSRAAEYAAQFDAPDDKVFWDLTIEYGLHRLKFDLAWIERKLEILAGN